MEEASLVAVRCWEILCIVWAIGTAVVLVRLRARPLHWGIFVGMIAVPVFDLMTGIYPFRLEFDARTWHYATIDGALMTYWAPLSYAGFFGLTLALCLRFRKQLDGLLGRWQLLVIPVLLGALDFPIEGILDDGLHVQRYHGESGMWWGVPWENLVFVAVGFALLLSAARAVEDLTGDRLDGSGLSPAAAVSNRVRAALGLILPLGSLSIGIIPHVVLTHLLQPFPGA